MSEIKLISPLLDGFSMGNPMSEHNGVRCCPAIKENTDKKYIVKIISIPASQVQMDALLLAGAYKDPADAMDYFRRIGEDVMKEAELLKKLSKLDGFLPYEGWQMEPITRRRLGYEVYLIGSYKRSLEKFLKKHPVTHLEAVNLGLDLCAALSVCREAGALYVALKPANIFVSDKKEYRIGDLGFIQMDALSYTALPEKYHSAYTPPELYDPMASLNLTVDTYAVGMILYQLYNDGQLPFKGNRLNDDVLPSPVNADYELAEIIMKAIHPDPSERWDDPGEMGKALAAYMQRNSVNDVPITPHTPLDVKPEDIVVISKKQPDAEREADASKESSDTNSSVSEVSSPKETAEEVTVETESADEDIVVEEITEIPMVEEAEESENSAEESSVPEEIVTSGEGSSAQEHDEEEDEISEELSKILSKADDLIAHELPEEILVPEIPEETDPFAFVEEDSDEIDDSIVPEDPVMDTIEEETPKKKKKKKKEKKYADPKYKRRTKRLISTLIFLLVLCVIGMGAFWYYQNMYLQTIDSITIDGNQEQITVVIDSNVDDSLLRVKCLDQYGKASTEALSSGTATFTGLQPNTMYTIQVEIDGFHKLVGKTSDVFTTDANTTIVSFTSVAGAEDGSVVLSFTVDGEEPDDWAVYYSTEGEDETRKTFTGHSVTINGLSVGKVYTFRLDPGENISLGGQTTLELMASRLILAENLSVTSSNVTDITITWDAPGDVVVDSWSVRCYSDAGYEEKATVTETAVTFPGMDPEASYTVEVTASGMTQYARTGITANPLNIRALNVDDSSHEILKLTWDYTGNDPDGGWLLIYKLVGGEKNVIKCEKASAEISPKIPGAKYEITIQAADGTTVFNSVHNYTVPDAEVFEKHNLTADNLTVDLLKTPEEDNWYCENIADDTFTDTFSAGDAISIAMRSSESFYLTGAEVDVLFVIRDAYGNILPDLVSEETFYWKNIWNGGNVKNGELDLPAVPASAGDYVLNIYFDGMSVAELNFTIT